ncbi:hypothetical protein D3C81_1361300 [compost metagenome]
MKKLIGAIALSVTATQVAMAQPAGESAQSHCTYQEEITFNCAIGKKHVSVCNSGGNLQYHFGKIGAAELVFPKAPNNNQSVARGSIMLSGGGGDYLRFSNGEYDYIAYNAEGRGGSSEGVVVEKGGKQVAALECSTYATNNLSTNLPDGIREDAKEFFIP